jgi:hypothetical protein
MLPNRGTAFLLMEMILLLTTAGHKEELVQARLLVTGTVMATAGDTPPLNL